MTRARIIRALMLAPVAGMMGSISPAASPATPHPVRATPATGTAARMLTAAAILLQTRRVADWQIAHRASLDRMPAAGRSALDPRDWQQSTFWVGLTELAARDRAYAAPIIALGRAEQWKLGEKPFHADDQLIAQAWIWASRNGAGPAVLAPARAYFDNVLANRQTGSLQFLPRTDGPGDPPCTTRWCWCDALFMAPPTLMQLTKATGDDRYAQFAHDEYRATADYLFDPTEHLFFRDSRFFDRRDGKGRKLFWSRGNGWVMAGLVRILQTLDANDSRRPYYVNLFREMAGRIVTLQKPDGYWAPSLLDTDPGTPPESSGTAFFTYAFAWGVDAGLLDPKTFRPAAINGWQALVRAVQPDGMLGWVQQVSDRPDSVAAGDTQFYGAGGFLLAGTAMYDLARGAQKR